MILQSENQELLSVSPTFSEYFTFIQSTFLSDLSICDDMIDFFKKWEVYHIPGHSWSTSKNTNAVDTDIKASTDLSFSIREVSSRFLGREDVLNRYLNELERMLQNYLNYFTYADHVPTFRLKENILIQWYKPGEGFKKFHHEMIPHRGRHLVFQTFLNTIKDAGETEFHYQDYKCEAIKGKTLIWPPDWTHTHRGIVSETEDKYVITGWWALDD